MKVRLALTTFLLLSLACRRSPEIDLSRACPNLASFHNELEYMLMMQGANCCAACRLSRLAPERLRGMSGTQMRFPCDLGDDDCISDCPGWTVTAVGFALGKPYRQSEVEWRRPPLWYAGEWCQQWAQKVRETQPPAEPLTLETLVYMSSEQLPADTLIRVSLTATWAAHPVIVVTCTSVENVPASSLNLPNWWPTAPRE